ncbi:zinc finger protein 271-like isoform X2 [Ischnura elegans]|uniref:zinc finger protein 271-like isoform X2 n=1 Tax=Ischnura elegans TaxID=197161 RepID=UPI001ED8ABCF|nr:zinc finger protein 271-like isoform X2 [Ischnura elegans]
MSRTMGIFTNSTERNSESDVCRLCRKNHYYFCNLFTSNVEYEISVKHVLHDLVGLQVDEGDGLPTTICSPCLKKLKDFSLFKKTCLESDTELRKISSRNNCGNIKGEGAAEDEPGSSSETKDCIRDASEDTSPIPCSVQVTEIYIPVPECEPPLDNMLFNMKAENKDQLGEGNYAAIYTPDPAENSDNAPDPLATDDLTLRTHLLLGIRRWKHQIKFVTDHGDFGTYRSSHVKEDQISDNEGGCVHNDLTDGTPSKLANEASSNQIPLQAQPSTASHGKEMEVESSGAMVTDLKWNLIGAKKEPSPKENTEPVFMEDREPIEGITMAHESTPEALGFLAAKGMSIGGTSTSHLSAEGNVMNHSIDECIDPTSLLRQIDSKVGESHFGIERNLMDELGEKGDGPLKETTGRKRDEKKMRRVRRSFTVEEKSTLQSSSSKSSCIKNLCNRVGVRRKEESYSCSECTLSFPRRKDLTKHKRIHMTDTSYSCNECKKSYVDETHLVRHVCIHTGYRPYMCNLCSDSFSEKNNLVKHMRRHTGERPFSCRICEQSFTDKSSLRSHMRTHTGEKPFSCTICKRSFASGSNLRRHMRMHSGEMPFKCDVCSRSFTGIGHLNRHVCVGAGEMPYACQICQKRFIHRSTLNIHMRTHTGERPYSCYHCEKSFSAKTDLVKHVRIHTGEKPYTCHVCSKSFSCSKERVKHLRTHTGEKSYECSICKKSFTEKGALRMHIRIHTGEKPHSCSICKQSFACRSNLICHIRTHTGEKPFKCNVCSRSFGQGSHLKSHMRVHTGEKPYSCQICKKSFTQSSSLSNHMRLHTGEKPYQCDICCKSFGTNAHLSRHMGVHK